MKTAGIVVLLLSFGICFAANQTQDLIELFRKSVQDFRDKNYALSLKAAEMCVQRAPQQPTFRYHLSRLYAVTGKPQQSLGILTNLANSGVAPQVANEEAFSSLKEDSRFSELTRRFEQNRKPAGTADVAYTLPEKDLIAEGIAYDPVSDTFFVGSTYRRKILAINANGNVSNFTAEQQDGLWGLVGMKVDAKRRRLWACHGNAGSNMYMKNADDKTKGFAGINKYDLESGKLLKKYLLQIPGEEHFLNDLTVAANGDVFTTDSTAGAVYRISAAKDDLELLIDKGSMSYPNGIALSPDEKHLYIAHVAGISVYDLQKKTLQLLQAADDVITTGIDGLIFYENSLVAVQAMEGVERIARFFFKDFATVDRAQVYLRNHPLFQLPTTGIRKGDDYYLIANSQLRSFDENGIIFPPEKLKETFILKFSVK